MDGLLYQTDTLLLSYALTLLRFQGQEIKARGLGMSSGTPRSAMHMVRKEREISECTGDPPFMGFFPPPLDYLHFCFTLRYLEGTVRDASKAVDLQQQKDEQSH